jgi:hypothetical protein
LNSSVSAEIKDIGSSDAGERGRLLMIGGDRSSSAGDAGASQLLLLTFAALDDVLDLRSFFFLANGGGPPSPSLIDMSGIVG